MVKNNAQYRIIEENCEIGDDTRIRNFCHIRSSSKIGTWCNIGNNVYIDSGVIIWDRVKIQNGVNIYHGVEIGSDVFVGPSVTFTNDLHPRAFIWSDEKISKTYVKDGVSIGANATIRCWITLHHYSMIGSGSVVTKDVPPYCLLVWNPGKIVGLVKKDGTPVKDIFSYILRNWDSQLEISFEWETFSIPKTLLHKNLSY